MYFNKCGNSLFVIPIKECSFYSDLTKRIVQSDDLSEKKRYQINCWSACFELAKFFKSTCLIVRWSPLVWWIEGETVRCAIANKSSQLQNLAGRYASEICGQDIPKSKRCYFWDIFSEFRRRRTKPYCLAHPQTGIQILHGNSSSKSDARSSNRCPQR